MRINEIVVYIIMLFMPVAAVDRFFAQFGDSARVADKFGKSIENTLLNAEVEAQS